MKLHEAPDDFRGAIQRTARALEIREVYVEKDYWVVFLLKRLSLHPDMASVVFKGGTSLSKAYGVVKRFSEDVDLAILPSGRAQAATKDLIRKIEKDIAAAPFAEVEDLAVTNKKGVSRRTLHEYPRAIAGGEFGLVRDKVLLEINCFDDPSPFAPMEISSFIAQYLSEHGFADAVREYEIEPISIQVLDWRVTFAEKVLSLAYASFEDGAGGTKEVRARIRHFYDLTVMLADQSIQTYLGSEEFFDILSRSRGGETLDSRTKWIGSKLSAAPLFAGPQKILTVIEGFYRPDLRQIVFSDSDLPDFLEVRKCITQVSNRLVELDL